MHTEALQFTKNRMEDMVSPKENRFRKMKQHNTCNRVGGVREIKEVEIQCG